MPTKPTNEQRSYSLVSPEMLQVIVPLVIAMLSGFVMHDRLLSSLKTEVDGITKQLDKFVETQAEKDSILNKLTSHTDVLSVQITNNRELIKSNEDRIREIERKMNEK